MERIANSSFSFVDVESDTVLIHSQSQGDDDEVIGAHIRHLY